MTVHHGLRAAAGNTTAAASLVTSGLELHLDAADTNSYSGSGTTWADLSGNGYDFSLSSSSQFNTDSNGYKNMNTGGSSGDIKRIVNGNLTNIPNSNQRTAIIFAQPQNVSTWRTIFKAAGSSYLAIARTGSGEIGIYHFGTGTGFYGSGGYISDPPNYLTKYNAYVFKWDANNSPYFSFQYNNDTTVNTITNSNVSYALGFAHIGGIGLAIPLGRIAVVLSYNRHLSQTEIDQNYDFYKARFGI